MLLPSEPPGGWQYPHPRTLRRWLARSPGPDFWFSSGAPSQVAFLHQHFFPTFFSTSPTTNPPRYKYHQRGLVIFLTLSDLDLCFHFESSLMPFFPARYVSRYTPNAFRNVSDSHSSNETRRSALLIQITDRLVTRDGYRVVQEA